MFKTYYQLIKPGIIRGNAIPATAGFFLASRGNVSYLLLLETLAGISLVIASGCVFNNYLDRHIDKKMARTKNRAIVQGLVSKQQALTYASVLGLLGLIILAVHTNWLTVAIGVAGLFFYVIVYGIAKRRSVHSTLIGSISGALPPVAGYTAVTGRLDAVAITLFFILVFLANAAFLRHFLHIDAKSIRRLACRCCRLKKVCQEPNARSCSTP